jgi:hypothetical protein
MNAGLAFLFDLDGTLVDSVYRDPFTLFRHLDEVGIRLSL